MITVQNNIAGNDTLNLDIDADRDDVPALIITVEEDDGLTFKLDAFISDAEDVEEFYRQVTAAVEKFRGYTG